MGAKIVITLLAMASGSAAFPKTCNAYNECGSLQGDCCPNKEGVMLDCCVLGAIRMEAEAAESKAAEAKQAAEEAASLANEKEEAAKEAQEAAEEAQKAAEEAQKAAEQAKATAEKAAEEQKAKAAAAKEAESEAQEESERFSNMNERIHASKCENNAACAAANLTGYCCPTLNGISLNGTMLGCCVAAPSKGPLLL